MSYVLRQTGERFILADVLCRWMRRTCHILININKLVISTELYVFDYEFAKKNLHLME